MKNTFKVDKDPKWHLVYVYQAIDESDTNHSENDNPDDMVGECKKTPMKTYFAIISTYGSQLSNNTQI